MADSGVSYSEHRVGPSPSEPPPLLLIHGAGGNRFHWPPELRRMKGKWVFTLELPGHGESNGEGQSTIEGFLCRVIDWMEETDLQKAVWVGHSMGGAIALTAAQQNPELVSELVLVSTGARLPVHPTLLELTRAEGSFDKAVETIMTWAFSDAAPTRLKQLAGRRMAETRPAILHQDLLACNSFDRSPYLEEITAPTLIICGTEDRMTPAKYSRQLAQSIPNAVLKLVQGAGHMVMLEHPRIVAGLIAAFLAEIAPRNEPQKSRTAGIA